MALLRNKKAQAIIGEYVLTLFLVVGVITAMTLFFKRTIQARMRDARLTMFKTVRGSSNATLYIEYEPYYGNRDSTVDRQSLITRHLLQGGSSGLFRKEIDETTSSQSAGYQAPPKDAN